MSGQSGDVLDFFNKEGSTKDPVPVLGVIIVGCFEATKQYADEVFKTAEGHKVQLEIYHVTTLKFGKKVEDSDLRQQIQYWITHLNSQGYVKIISLSTTNGFRFVSERSKIARSKRLWDRNWRRAKMPADLLAGLQAICVKEQHQASA